MSYLGEADRIKRQLEDRYPGWRIWFVPGQGRTVTWCAQRLPLLNEDSPEHLAEAIEQAEAGGAGPDAGKDNISWLP